MNIPINTTAVFNAIDATLDLSASNRNPHRAFAQLGPASQDAYLKNLARLLQHGVIGTETILKNNQPQERFITPGLADHAPPARRIDYRI